MPKTEKIKSNFTGTIALCSNCYKSLDNSTHRAFAKNRHNTHFWGLPEKKIMCGNCLFYRRDEMPPKKRYLWNQYKKRGYWEKEQ